MAVAPIESITAKPLALPPPSRFWILDFVRVLAALGIVAFHTLSSLQIHVGKGDETLRLIEWLNYGGAFGVSAFFVLSGFSIHLSHARRRPAGDATRPASLTFLRRRLSRLYPAYLAAIAVCITVNLFWAWIRNRDLSAQFPSLWNLFTHLFLIHPWMSKTFFGIVPAFWFVGVIAHLYLLYLAFDWMTSRWGVHRALCAVAACTAAVRWVAFGFGMPSAVPEPNTAWLLAMNAPSRWFEWGCGAWVAHSISTGKRLAPSGGVVGLILMLAWLVLGVRWPFLYEPLLGLGIAIFIWGIVSESRFSQRPVLFMPLIFLGEISYALFLLHQIFVPYVSSALDSKEIPAVVLFALEFVLVLVITLPIATVIHRWVERPFAAKA